MDVLRASLRCNHLLSDQAVVRLLRYTDLVLEKNVSMNLTSCTCRRTFVSKHLADSLSLLDGLDAIGRCPHSLSRLRRQHEESAAAPATTATSVMDVGTGAGLPGLVLAAACAGDMVGGGSGRANASGSAEQGRLHVTMVDTRRKKVDFVAGAIKQMGLEQSARALWGRAETLARSADHRAQYDVVVSRAVAELRSLVELCLPFVRVGGHALLPKKLTHEFDEVGRARLAVGALGGELVGLVDPANPIPGLILDVSSGVGKDNSILVIRKTTATPDRFPRGNNRVLKSPL